MARVKVARAAAVEVEAASVAGTPASRRLCQEISQQTGGVTLLGCSRGKDSLAAWLWLREFFPRIIPFHCASVPHLSFVDESLAALEEHFGTPIERVLSGDTSAAVAALLYQPFEDEAAIDALDLWDYGNLDVAELLREKHGVPRAWCAFGINQSDSIDRRVYVRQQQGRSPRNRTFYPCFDWPAAMILDVVRASGVRLPGDYRLANRSLSGMPSPRHLERMESVYPEDFARVETVFPFIRATRARNEFRRMRQSRAPASRGQESAP